MQMQAYRYNIRARYIYGLTENGYDPRYYLHLVVTSPNEARVQHIVKLLNNEQSALRNDDSGIGYYRYTYERIPNPIEIEAL